MAATQQNRTTEPLVEVDGSGGHTPYVIPRSAAGGTPVVDTELPAAAALADNTANPTVPGVGAYLMALDGATWDRVLMGAQGLLTVGKDNGPSWTSARGNVSSADASGADVDLTAAPTTGQKIVIDDLWVSVDTAMRVDVKEETAGTVVWSAYLPANGSVQYTPRDGQKLDTANKKALFRTSAAGNVRVTANYHSEG